MFASDQERERAAGTLKQHYVDGRLTLDEVSARTDVVLSARSRAELRSALADLPWLQEDLLARGGAVLRAAGRGALLAVCTGAWLLFSLALALVFALTALFQDISGSALLGFLLVWLVPTYLISRLWHRPHARR